MNFSSNLVACELVAMANLKAWHSMKFRSNRMKPWDWEKRLFVDEIRVRVFGGREWLRRERGHTLSHGPDHGIS
jgi:hypothetical protein